MNFLIFEGWPALGGMRAHFPDFVRPDVTYLLYSSGRGPVNALA